MIADFSSMTLNIWETDQVLIGYIFQIEFVWSVVGIKMIIIIKNLSMPRKKNISIFSGKKN